MYKIQLERTAERDLGRLAKPVHERVILAIHSLSNNPRPAGAKKLTGSKNDWRVRVGDYRILYEIADAVRVIRIFRVRHRSDAYRS